MRPIPQNVRFAPTSKKFRVAGWVFLGALALCAVSYGAARATEALEYKRAAVFLEELKSIQPGQSQASVMPFISRYDGTLPDQVFGVKNDAYIVRIDPWHLMHPIPGPNWIERAYEEAFLRLRNWRRRVKLRSWTTDGEITFTNGKVDTVSGGIIIEGENEWLMANWHYAPEIPAYLWQRHPDNGSSVEPPQYIARWTHLHFDGGTGEGILTSVTPRSTPEELNAARDINLQCLVAGRGCRSLCELMPYAMRYRREHSGGAWGWASGDWGVQPHDCE